MRLKKLIFISIASIIALMGCGAVKAATGTKDVAYKGLTAQINAMNECSDSFIYTENGFSEGNLMYTIQ